MCRIHHAILGLCFLCAFTHSLVVASLNCVWLTCLVRAEQTVRTRQRRSIYPGALIDFKKERNGGCISDRKVTKSFFSCHCRTSQPGTLSTATFARIIVLGSPSRYARNLYPLIYYHCSSFLLPAKHARWYTPCARLVIRRHWHRLLIARAPRGNYDELPYRRGSQRCVAQSWRKSSDRVKAAGRAGSHASESCRPSALSP